MELSIGTHVPRRGNAFSRGFARLLMWLMGWRIEGAIPDLPKMVLIGAPHTTNMDGVIGLGTLMMLGMRAGTMIKDSAFRGFMGILLRWFGAIPINRKSAKGVVEQSVDAFNGSKQLLLLIAPEGTRSNATEWKRGFHHIAAGANVPILPAACDYKRKIITFGPPVYTTDDYDADLMRILRFIADHGSPRHPERMSKPLCDLMGVKWQHVDDKDE